MYRFSNLDYLYTVMELGSNSLEKWLFERNAKENSTIDREKMYTMFIQICTAVKYIHGSGSNGKLHGNLKPSNILHFPQGLIKLSDIGATVENGSADSSDTAYANPYLPNDLQGDVGKYHLDVFSLGWCLNGILCR